MTCMYPPPHRNGNCKHVKIDVQKYLLNSEISQVISGNQACVCVCVCKCAYEIARKSSLICFLHTFKNACALCAYACVCVCACVFHMCE